MAPHRGENESLAYVTGQGSKLKQYAVLPRLLCISVLLSHPSCCGKHAAWDAVIRKTGGQLHEDA